MSSELNFTNDEIEDDLHEHYKFVAAKGQSPLRVDKFLMNLIENATRNKIQQAADAGQIWVNQKPVKSNYRVKAFDVVQVMLSHPPYEYLLEPEQMDLDIRYEDDDLIVLHKPPGLVVHPGHGNYSGTLVNGLIHHFNQLPLNATNRPGLVHRIDKDTSGLLVVAKTDWAMAQLTKQFAEKTTDREYVALVWGNVEKDAGTIDGHIGRHPKDRMQMSVYPDGNVGKHARTHYKVLERFEYVTLLSCQLETGRTHQIRAHMKHLGHTLFNDARYGGDQILKGTTFSKYKQFIENCFKALPRQALHAKTLGFIHPTTNEYMSFDSEIPQDITDCIEKWRNYAKAFQT